MTSPLKTPANALPVYEVPKDAIELLNRLTMIGRALSAEKDIDRLLGMILSEAQSIAHADGGTLYYRNDKQQLEFAIVRNDSLGIAYGGDSGVPAPMPPLDLYDPETGDANLTVQAAFSVLKKRPINIEDVYAVDVFDFKGTRAFDAQHGYRTTSVLTIPLINHKNQALGCLQLVNAKDTSSGAVVPFTSSIQQVVQALASQAAVILDNKQLIESQQRLLESFIELIAKAIDRKSPYTGEHCERVPAIMEMLVDAACRDEHGPFSAFKLSEEEKYEVHIASWLHDCGKITTPVHVMDKATKLETIFDRIELIRTRWDVLKRDARIAMLEALAAPNADKAALEKHYADTIAQLDEDLAFIEGCNTGGEFMADEKITRLKEIAARHWQHGAEKIPALSDNELYNLSIRRGTITDEERQIMNDHMVVTCEMLEALPFPKHLQNVPEYACGHHERMDGKGYPKAIKAGNMSIPARMMAVADVFEALTASDRPYKPAKKLSETMHIIGQMKKTNHLDPVIVDFLITSGVYKEYARTYLMPHLIDEIDETALLAIQPLPM